MAQKRKRAFDGLYAQLEETDGNVVLFSAKGEPSVIFEMTNPVQQLCTDAEQYLRFQDVLSGVVQTLGEGYALQKQDILCKQSYRHEVPENAEFLTKSYFRYFEGREFTEIRTFLIITQEACFVLLVGYEIEFAKFATTMRPGNIFRHDHVTFQAIHGKIFFCIR